MISSAIWNKQARVKFFKDCKKIALARRANAIYSLLKIYECLFIPNCTRNIQVSTSDIFYHASVFYVTNGGIRPRQPYWMKIKRKNSFAPSKSCMKTEQILFTVKSSLYSQLN